MFDNNIEDNSFVLVMDDASYSGLQITQYLVDYLKNVKDKKINILFISNLYICASKK